MDPLRNIRPITDAIIQDPSQLAAESKQNSTPISSEDASILETAQPSVLPDLQASNLFESTLESNLDSMHSLLNDVDEKLELVKSHSDSIKNQLDSMSEMGELASIRLNMARDRLSKFLETLAHLLQKLSQTADDITQNLK